MYYTRWGPRNWLAAGVVAASMFAGAPAQAVAPLPPDVELPFAATTAFGAPTGTFVIAAEQTVGGAGALHVTGRSAVWREANGELTFYYQVTNLPDSTHEMKRLTTNGYSGWEIWDAGHSETGFSGDGVTFLGGTAAGDGTGTTLQAYDNVDRSSGVLNGGETVGWDFPDNGPPSVPSDPTLFPGQTTVIMVLKTHATHYTTTTWQYINGAVDSGAGFAPAAVPEPASMLLAGAGLAPLAGLLKRRRRSSETEETEEVA